MPNWCENEVEITFGDTTEYDKFIEQVGDINSYIGWKSKAELFSKFYPTPPEMLEGEGWWDWRIENWGTKWDPQINDFTDQDGLIYIRMETAWAPPREFFMKFTELFPSATVNLSYLEEGMNFCGKSEFFQGVDANERYINDIPKEMYVAVGYKLDSDGEIDWLNSDDTTTLWDIIADDEQFNKYLEMEVA